MIGRVILAPGEPRCRPSRACPDKGHCERQLAALPSAGAIVGDFSITPLGNTARDAGAYPQYLSAEAARLLQGKAAGPVVHEPIGGY
ncbi:MAG: hypothetical protein JNL87_09295 [Burkholderiaceae bacterium]|nr:hypothetical protein [Burkholderiaceae bacterium]